MAVRSLAGTPYQVVLLLTGFHPDLHPLIDPNHPAFLLPICNNPIISYQLHMLENAGLTDVIVVAYLSSRQYVERFFEGYAGSVRPVFEFVEDDLETAECLNAIKSRITTNFFVVNHNLVTDTNYLALADIHRTRNSSLTMLLYQNRPDERKISQKDIESSIFHFIGIDPDISSEAQELLVSGNPYPARVLYNTVALGSSSNLKISKKLLRRHPTIRISRSIQDCGLYLFSHWVVDLLGLIPDLVDIREDLVPYLVMNQFKATIPGVSQEIVDCITNRFSQAQDMSSTSFADAQDLIKCHALIVDHSQNFCGNMSSIASFSALNREVLRRSMRGDDWRWPEIERNSISTTETKSNIRESLFGSHLELGHEVSITSSIIGSHCTIGPGSKISGCVIMDHVTIGSRCKLQNTIIGSNATIGESSSLNNCQIGPNCEISEESNHKDESFASEEESLEYGY